MAVILAAGAVTVPGAGGSVGTTMSPPDQPTDNAHHGEHPDAAAVRRANAAFYEAFEGRDLDAMSDIWDHTDQVACVHPGWAILQGWAAVAASWYALFDGPQRLQFIVTDERVEVVGDVAWVTCNENLLDTGAAQAVAATNLFVRRDGGWRLVHHHGSPVAQRLQARGS
jgi:ketosteroid isomerase-like protein